MLSKFFIDRPIFATVISLVIIIGGLVAQITLPIAKFPEITPPTVQVTAAYPGADAQVISDTVAAPIEQEVNGVEGMLYMSSVCSADGTYTLTVTFNVGVDIDMAQVLVQNRVGIATPKLPEEVRRQGVTTKKQSTAIVQFITISSPTGAFDDLYLSNYATINLRDELGRLKGVGEAKVFGVGDYSMRIWLDPTRLKSRNLTTNDVVNAIREQNVQVAAGQLGQRPTNSATAFQYTVTTLGRLNSIEQFENIIVRTEAENRTVRVKDVATVQLGTKDYTLSARTNGVPCAAIAIYQLPGANALELAANVRKKMDELAAAFPKGMEYNIPFDTTLFVEASIEEVYTTLWQAILLVVLVIYIFLQDWRTTLIPCIAIPVSLIGTFAIMAGLGFSINMLTLFGIVLAIGIVVDDAIVVVENTARHLDAGLPRRDAAKKAMEEITGPVVATTLVLLAVFVPTAAMSGITGQLYKQFALTISAAVLISTINALTLSPALCGLLMRPTGEVRNWFFIAFNRFFQFGEGIYGASISALARRLVITGVLFVALLGLTATGFMRLPLGFLPLEDEGYLFVNVQLPDAAALGRTDAVLDRLDTVFKQTPGVADWVSIGGYSLLTGASGSNSAMVFVVLKPWDERKDGATSIPGVLKHLQGQFALIQEAVVFAFPPPPIQGLGNAAGFEMQILDKRGVGLDTLQTMTNEVVQQGNSQPTLEALNTTFRATTPQFYADIDREKVKTVGVPLSDVFETLQSFLGSTYVNDFNLFGRTFQVRVQAEQQYRTEPSDINRLEVRNRDGAMVPLGTLVTVKESFGAPIIRRFQMYPAAQINGRPAPGVSSGQALDVMEQLVSQVLPDTMGFGWTGMSYQERLVGNEQYVIFLMAVVFVFMVLAAQYESWTSPAAVIAVVPLAALGVVAMLMLRGSDNNTYTQIGVVLLVALASKNAILIVEFASELRREGKSIVEAAISAARLRFRAILMTAFSSILGFLPLLIAAGAGAASRQAVGSAVVGGMTAATVFSLLLVPSFFVIFQSLAEWGKKPAEPAASTSAGTAKT